jgi:CcmD family protein
VQLDANGVVLGVALLVWGLLFFYLVRLERRIKDLEKR